ncbi:acyltransferase [Blastococcus sp. CT_GayMR20]|uniref:acyltransferase family protein n=1 Tax=Blastococcus sp. CT_GayMR20 TaxID=2559609 RepID=UPI0010735DBF|nr:acyltransferase family protein [Blastococcus sp. CT_GayMR20]TFV92688.1 acyltransferase [Blastococcus sp. CT_GayMR20]TFV92731.1 acyltransferase [Blastococcus sp. CT_GayMR20]
MTTKTAADSQARPQDAAATRRPSHFRRDIEGLRAVAVGLVLLDHVLGWPAGGFIGVDVFFVISGFLITGLLVRERRKTGGISFRDFYRRRARRLMPAAVATLVVTNLAMWTLFLDFRALQATKDSIWALLFGANIRFAQVGTDYFQTTSPPSPVQHFWSLAVEEQFYLVWPLLILAVFAVAARRRRSAVRLLGGVVLVAAAASFAWSVYATDVSATTAYFSTFARAWELAVGAAVALAAARLHRLPHALQVVGAWVGLAGVIASAFVIDVATPFPGWAAALPVLSTALIIAFGHVRQGPGTTWALGSGVMRYLGRISYSLYLWHWPVVVILRDLFADSPALYYPAAIGGALFLASVSYYVIEQPVLHSGWLLGKERDTPIRGSDRVFRRARAVAFGTLLAVGVPAIALGVLFPPGQLSPQQVAAAELAVEVSPAGDSSDEPAEDPLITEIRQSIGAATWPTLDPPLERLSGARAPEWVDDECLNVTPSREDECRYGPADAASTAVLLGDSVAISWLPGLREAMEPKGWSIQPLTFEECPNIAAEVKHGTSSSAYPECTEHRTWALQRIAELRPDMVILSNSYGAQLLDEDADVYSTWGDGLEEVAGQITATGAKVVVLGMPPSGKSLQECVTAISDPSDCNGPPSEESRRHIRVEKAGAEAAGATYVDPTPWFCFRNTCPAVVGSTPVFSEGVHLTPQYSRKLAPQLERSLLGDPAAPASPAG